jgi:hypothetical protein
VNVIYELVLITALGATTPLASYPDFNSCLKERVQITQQSNAQYTVACLPAQSPEDLERRLNQSAAALMGVIKKMQEAQK